MRKEIAIEVKLLVKKYEDLTAVDGVSFTVHKGEVLPLPYLTNGLRDAIVYGNVSSAIFNTAVTLGVGVFFILAGALITNWREE